MTHVRVPPAVLARLLEVGAAAFDWWVPGDREAMERAWQALGAASPQVARRAAREASSAVRDPEAYRRWLEARAGVRA